MKKKKNKAAMALGRLGGLARARNLTKEELSKIAKMGAIAASKCGKKLGRPRLDKSLG